jgi:TetR/AcrR family transcriptional regulator, transcriptional repressor for nem operon
MKKKEQSGQTRLKILQAAIREIHHCGYKAASLDNILATTDLTKGALYHHFSDKRDLTHAILEEYLSLLVDQFWINPLVDCEDPIACLQYLFSRNIAGMPDEEVFYGCLLNNPANETSGADEELRAHIDQIYKKWEQAFADALRKGQKNETVSKAINPDQVANFIIAALAGGRSLAKNTKSREPMIACGNSLVSYLGAVCKPL